MISIKVNGEFLELTKETSITLELNNPIFAEEIIPGSYSYPFSIPFGDESPTNSRILNHADIIENHQIIKEVNADVYYLGSHFKSGILQCGKIAGGTMSVNFIFGIRAISKEITSTKIPDICSESLTMSDAQYLKRVIVCCNTSAYPNGPFEIIVNGRTYTGASNRDLISAILNDTATPKANAIWVNSPYTRADGVRLSNDYFWLQPDVGARDYKTPLMVDIPEGSSFLKVHIDASEFSTAYNGPIMDWIYRNQNDPRFCFPMLYNGGMFMAEDIKRFGFQDFNFSNYWADGRPQLNPPNYFYRDLILGVESTFIAKNITSVQPFIKLKWVIEKCAAYFGIRLEGDFLATADYNSALFFHSNTLEERIQFIGRKDWLATKSQWNTSEFLPDITFIDLLKALINRFCVTVYLNEASGRIRIQSRKTVIDSPSFTEMTHVASPKEGLEFIGKDYTVEALPDDSDMQENSDKFQSGQLETLTTTITSLSKQQSFTIYNFELFNSTVQTYSLPVSSRPIDTKIPTVFIFYNGSATTTGSGNQSTYESAKINSSDGPFRFQDGMIERRWKGWLRFLKIRKEVAYPLSLSLHQLMHINWERKIMVDRNKFLIKSIKVKLGATKIEQAQVELYSTL